MRNVSVVVNTYNRASSLRLTLEGLKQLEYPMFEVVVVNGPSTDDTADVLREHRDIIKIGHCENRNLSESRNIGIGLAAGEIIAFIDDDAYPDPAWLDRLVEGYNSDEVAGVGGPVYDHTGARLQTRYLTSDRFGISTLTDDLNPSYYLSVPGSLLFPSLLGTNSSFRRDLLVRIGGFDEEFEYFLDETDICCRLVDLGYLIRLVEDGYVYHKFLPSDIRGESRAARDRFAVMKNTCYFALMHGMQTTSFYDACKALVDFVEIQRADYRWTVDHLLLTEQDYKQFESDIPRAFDRGYQDFAAGAPRTRPPSWFAGLEQEFLPFPVVRQAGDKLHLCFFSQEYPPGPVGGIGRVVHTLATGLAAEGHLVRVLTRGQDHDRVDLEDGTWVHRVVPVDQPPPAADVPAHIWAYSASLLAELRRIHSHRPVDLVEVPNWDAEGIAVLLDGGFKTVVSLHTPMMTVKAIDPRLAADPVVDQIIRLERFCYLKADGLLANTSAVVAEIERSYRLTLPRRHLRLVPHGLPDAADVAEAIDTGPHPTGALKLLFVGRLEKRKGIDVLLECIPSLADQFPQLVVTIAGNDALPGEGGMSYRAAFERSPHGRRLADRVRFTGTLGETELRRLYAECDIFVAPSRYESFGLILVEAMMFGRPVVACRIGGIEEVVHDGENGILVPPGDPEALGEALAHLCGSPERRAAFGRASRQIYLREFSLDRMIGRANQYYDDMVGRSTVRPAPQRATQ